MTKSILTASALRTASDSFKELYNDNGLTVHALKSGRFEIVCGSTRTYAHSLEEVSDKVDGLDLHTFPCSGAEVLAGIQEGLAGQFCLNIIATDKAGDRKERIVHSVRGTRQVIADHMMGVASVSVEDMTGGKRYAMQDNMYGGEYAILVPMVGEDLYELSPSMGSDMYEPQKLGKGDILYGIYPQSGEVMSLLVVEAYPNGTFKDDSGKIYTENDIDLYQLVLGEEAQDDNYQEPDASLFDSEDIPTYNPTGTAETCAPMIGDLANYNVSLSSSAEVLFDFVKSVNKSAYLEQSSLNKISVSAVNAEGQATDGILEWNCRLASPSYSRSSVVTIPMTMVKGSVELGKEFITSTGRKYPMTAAGITAHLGVLASDEEFVASNTQSVHASTIHADKDIDVVAEAVARKKTAGTRLRDHWEHLTQQAQDADRTKDYESYSEWLNRLGVSEEDDDGGAYGDENPVWGEPGEDAYVKEATSSKKTADNDLIEDADTEEVARLVSEGMTSGQLAPGDDSGRIGSWSLDIDFKGDTDYVIGDISEMIKEGYTSGKVNSYENEKEVFGWWTLTMDMWKESSKKTSAKNADQLFHVEGMGEEIAQNVEEEGVENLEFPIDVKSIVVTQISENSDAKEIRNFFGIDENASEEEVREVTKPMQEELTSSVEVPAPYDDGVFYIGECKGAYNLEYVFVPKEEMSSEEVDDKGDSDTEEIIEVEDKDGDEVEASKKTAMKNADQLFHVEGMGEGVAQEIQGHDLENLETEPGNYEIIVTEVSTGAAGKYQIEEASNFFGIDTNPEDEVVWEEIDTAADVVAQELNNSVKIPAPYDNGQFYFGNNENDGAYNLLYGFAIGEEGNGVAASVEKKAMDFDQWFAENRENPELLADYDEMVLEYEQMNVPPESLEEFARSYFSETTEGIFAGKKTALTTPEQHQKRIALDTLKMTDAGAGVMGGMTKEEARKFLSRVGYSEDQIKKLEASVEKTAIGTEPGTEMSDEQISESYGGLVVDQAEMNPSGQSGWIYISFSQETATGDESVGGGFIIYDDGKVAFDFWLPTEQYYLLSNFITHILKDEKEVSNMSESDIEAKLKEKGLSDISKSSKEFGVETITTMQDLSEVDDVSTLIPAGSYRGVEDGKITVVTDGTHKFKFIWKEGQPVLQGESIASVKTADAGDLLVQWDSSDIIDSEIQYIKEEAEEDHYAIEKLKENNEDYSEEQLKSGEYDSDLLDMVAGDSDMFDMHWEDFVEGINSALEEMGKDHDYLWKIKGSSMGWQNRSGEETSVIKNFADLQEKVLPNTSDFTLKLVKDGAEGMTMTVSHHDSPRGETYEFFPFQPLAEGTEVIVNNSDEHGTIVGSMFDGADEGPIYTVKVKGENGEEEELELYAEEFDFPAKAE